MLRITSVVILAVAALLGAAAQQYVTKMSKVLQEQ